MGRLSSNFSLTKRVFATAKLVSATNVHEFQEMPSPKGLPFLGTTPALLAAGAAPKLHDYIDKRHRQLGPIFKENVGPVSCVFISDPDEMRSVFAQEGKHPVHILPNAWMVYNEVYGCSRGLFFMNGDEWLYFRRIMNKLLLKGDLSWVDKSCNEIASRIVDKIKYKSDPHHHYKTLDGDLYKWSLDILVCILLSPEVYKTAVKDIDKLVTHLSQSLNSIFETSAKLQLLPAKMAYQLGLPVWKRFEKSVDSALFDTNQLVVHLLDQYPNGEGLLQQMSREEMNLSELIRIVVDLVIAAGDTTAYSMQWILYLIAKHPDIQEELRQDLKQHKPSQLLKNIIRETLRLYPVAPFLTRILPEESTIKGYKIPPGTPLILSIYTSGRDPKYFENPNEFQPGRWLRTGANNSAKASLPFAMGARSCIGKKIAETQLQTTLGKIVENFRVELLNKKEVKVSLKMVAVPAEPIRLKFHSL